MLYVSDVGQAAETKYEKARRLDVTLSPGMPSGQDFSRIDRQHNIFAVADGVGGSFGSDMAAQRVCETYVDVIADRYGVLPEDNAREYERNYAVLDKLHTAALGTLATTTFTGMIVQPYGVASYLHAGDSQLLLYRNNTLVRCTSEHVRSGNKLLNYLGTPPEWRALGLTRPSLALTRLANTFSETKMEAEWGMIPLMDGDRFALVTDGILGSHERDQLSDETIGRIMNRRRILGAQACADLWLKLSKKLDDSTLVVVDINETHKIRLTP